MEAIRKQSKNVNPNTQTATYEEFGDFFVFTIVRNPYNRIMSTYKQLNEVVLPERRWNYPYPLDTFEDFVHSLPKIGTHEDPHVETQASFLKLPRDKDTDFRHIDYIGKLENLEESINYVAEQCGIKGHPFPKLNQSTERPTVEHTAETKQITREVYKIDFDIFNYEQ
jgi:hypothetical protein